MSIVTVTVIALVAVVAAIYIASHYNHLIMVKHNVDKAWANVDVLLKQRHDELPKLIAICKEHGQYERSLLEQLVHARNHAMLARQARNALRVGAAEATLHERTDRLLVLAEAVPALRANESFRQLTTRISELETAIADRRRFYNDTVQICNQTIEQFPGSLYASVFSFPRATRLDFSGERR